MDKISKESAIARLQALSNRTDDFLLGATDEFDKWRRDTQIAIRYIFGEHSRNAEEFAHINAGFSLALLSDLATFRIALKQASTLIQSMVEEVEEFWEQEPITSSQTNSPRKPTTACIFIGHGRNTLWARLQIHLENELGLKTVNYESESRAGESIVPILEKMLDQASFAVLVLTAEDETAVGSKRARQNVVHEAGLFQGRLGFKKAILLRQEGVEDFSNVAGLQYISFTGDSIEQTYYELQRVLKREGLL